MRSIGAHVTRLFAAVRARVRGHRADLREADAEVFQVLALQSGVPERVRRVLDPRNPLTHTVAAHAIPLLGHDAVAADAVKALQAVADHHAGKLADTLLDSQQRSRVRRRAARVLSAARSVRAADTLLLGLRDPDPRVRRQCGRALLVLTARTPSARPAEAAIYDAVLRETAADRVDLTLVFTLLALVLPRESIRSAYRALRRDDRYLRGTALEYLREVLPRNVRDALWPHVTGD